METNFKILGLPGSLRAGSFNTGLLRAARELAPAGVEVEIADISAIPLYNEDLNLMALGGAARAVRVAMLSRRQSTITL